MTSCTGGLPSWICQSGLPTCSAGSWRGKALEEALIVVDVLGDDVEVQALRLARVAVQEELQALAGAVAQPFLDREPVALGLADLLALLVQKQLVGEALGRRRVEDAADLRAEPHGIDQVLARHLVVDVEGCPAQRPVALPLHLAMAVGDRHLGQGAILVAEHDRAGLDPALLDRHLEHAAGLGRDRQDRAVGGAPLRPQGRQHDLADPLVPLQHLAQRRVERTAAVGVGAALEGVGEAELHPGTPAAARSCARRSSRACRTGRGWRSAAGPDAGPPWPGWARCPAPCATRPCRRRTRRARSASPTGARTPAAPAWCGTPRRRCRYAAGPTARSRSRTARTPWPAAAW